MSLADTLKGLVGKGKDAAAKNADKINQAVDKAGDFIDQKTHGKYTDKIEKGKEAAKKVVPPEHPGQPGQPGQPGPGPTPNP
ncbi:MT0933-like antitoxin protein [Nocardia amikacinitolerans]|uniref:MT0933-like antitoxin protein n=1 Tax=Nocardia amikacinitolerans TaxID=756689 RepID=A0A285LVY0_9NOCA|nr:antitoxin [Nocardia amikacinitolerans]MCP2279977.1 MT0933-like antitoxin protein [Nocardia amikacinitolerans]MCP2295753.1 MT0933-like antitoxin protein [Nocardia amikacinitolerans]MCP2317437.1 MT0933-like antitoxin protein [Nocardia amikacinitolerans]SNY87806.1 MT0933-like antitoxin protein [Nocardia amikacinitolerans]